MQIAIDRKLSHKVAEVSELFGWKREEIINQALLYYLDSILKQVSLEEEMKAWDMLSDEALVNFEKSI